LTKISKEIANGNFEVNIKVRAEGEVRELADALKNTVKLIRTTQKDLLDDNERLKEKLKRTTMIEKLLLNIHSEDNVDNIVFFILGAITSEVGLDYGRAIYLEYDSEQEVLRGKSSSTNLKFIDNENEFFKFQSGLKLHSESLDKVVKGLEEGK
jgi:cell division septum initiation protein DivIVA